MVVLRRYASALLLIGAALAQDGDYPEYQDYANDYGQEDNLYHDYAERASVKEAGYVIDWWPSADDAKN